MILNVETEQEEDGRWIAEIIQVRGTLAYGSTRQDAILRVKTLALRVLAERLDRGENLLGLGFRL